MHAGDHDVNVAPPGLPNRCSLPLYTFGEDIGHSEGRMAHLTGPLHPVQSNIVGLSRLCDPQAAYLTQCGKLPRLEPGDIIAIYFSADKRWWQGEVKVVVDRAVNQVILRFEERRKSVKIKLESERWIWKRIFAYGKVAERSIAKPLANTKPGATSARPPAAPNAKSTRTSKLPRSANPSGVAPKRKRARKKPAQPGPALAKPAAPSSAARKKGRPSAAKHAQPQPQPQPRTSAASISQQIAHDRSGGQATAVAELAVSQPAQQPVLKAVPSSSIEYTELVPPSTDNDNETPTEIPETPPEALVDLVQLDGPQLLNHDLLRKMQGVIISSVVHQNQELAP